MYWLGCLYSFLFSFETILSRSRLCFFFSIETNGLAALEQELSLYNIRRGRCITRRKDSENRSRQKTKTACPIQRNLWYFLCFRIQINQKSIRINQQLFYLTIIWAKRIRINQKVFELTVKTFKLKKSRIRPFILSKKYSNSPESSKLTSYTGLTIRIRIFPFYKSSCRASHSSFILIQLLLSKYCFRSFTRILTWSSYVVIYTPVVYSFAGTVKPWNRGTERVVCRTKYRRFAIVRSVEDMTLVFLPR